MSNTVEGTNNTGDNYSSGVHRGKEKYLNNVWGKERREREREMQEKQKYKLEKCDKTILARINTSFTSVFAHYITS